MQYFFYLFFLLIPYIEAQTTPLVFNGNFELGNFTGWTPVSDTNGGRWEVYQGSVTPISHKPFFEPPEGFFAALTDLCLPAASVLYQDVLLPLEELELSFTTYYDNRAGIFVTKESLSSNDRPNQQARVDITNPYAAVFATDPDSVLAPIFQTEPGDPTTMKPLVLTYDLTPFAGEFIRLRFASVATEGILNFAIDDVCIRITAPLPPKNLKGTACLDKTSPELLCVHILMWHKSPSPSVMGYHIYRNGKRICTLDGCHCLLYFEDYLPYKRSLDYYKVTAFNALGESTPLTLTLGCSE